MSRPRFRIVNPGRDQHYDVSTDECAVEVYDRTCAVESVAWDGGEDHYLVWAKTLTEATRIACQHIADGTTERHFDRERAYYEDRYGPEGWSEPVKQQSTERTYT